MSRDENARLEDNPESFVAWINSPEGRKAVDRAFKIKAARRAAREAFDKHANEILDAFEKETAGQVFVWPSTAASPYKKSVAHLDHIDIYTILDLFEVKSHAVGHAVKKLLCAGLRGAKGYEQDLQEAIASVERELKMIDERQGARENQNEA